MNTLGDLYEAIETVAGARKRFLKLEEQGAVELADEMMNRLLSELHSQLRRDDRERER